MKDVNVNHISFLAYVALQVPIYTGTFHQIVTSRAFTRRLFKLADADGAGQVSMQRMMDVFNCLSQR